MIWPLSETLKLIEACLPRQLVSERAFGHVQAMVHLLPQAMSAYYFECRLGANTTQVDFACCIIAGKGGREILANQATTADLPKLPGEHPLWDRVRAFLRRWADPTSPIYEQTPLIWLGFDQIDDLLLPLPCLSICLDPNYLESPARPAAEAKPERWLQCSEIILEDLLGQPLSPQTRQNLLACFEWLPAGGQISYLSAMLARQPVAVKVNGLIPQDQLPAYLSRLNWPGSMSAIEAILTRFCTAIDPIRFDLTVGPVMSARFGIEFFARGSSQSVAQQQLFLDQLVEQELCALEKRQALLNWSGFSSEVFSHQSWPTRLSRFWYAKIVHQPDSLLEAKAYLGFAPSRFSLFTLA